MHYISLQSICEKNTHTHKQMYMYIYIYIYHPSVHEATLQSCTSAPRHSVVNDFLVASHGNGLTFQWRCILDSNEFHTWREWLKDVISGVLTSSKHLDFNFNGFWRQPPKKCTVLSTRIPRTFPNPWSFHHVNDGIKDLGKGFTKERGAIQKWEHHFIHQSWFFIFTQTFWMNSKLTTSSKIILELDRNPKKPSTSIQFTHRKRALRPKKSVMRLLLRWGLQ